MVRRRDPDREAGRLLTEIYRAHATGAYRYAYHLTRSREDADDIVQAVFLGLHQALLRGETIVTPGAFLATAVKRRAINLAARRRAEPDSAGVEGRAAPNGGAGAAAELARIQVLLYTLPEAQHQAFVLRHWSGLSNREIAGVLATTEAAVESLLVRARSALMAAAAHDRECADVCARLAEDRPTPTADAAHISTCRGCRTAEQRLARAAEIAAAAVLIPNVHIAHALAAAVPGFSAGAAVSASGATVATAAGSKAGTAVLLAKTGAALVAVTAVVAVGIHAHGDYRSAHGTPPAHAGAAQNHPAGASTTSHGDDTGAVVTPEPFAQKVALHRTDDARRARHERAAAKDGHDGSDTGDTTTGSGETNAGSGDANAGSSDSTQGSGDSSAPSGGDGSGPGTGSDGGGTDSSSGQIGDGGSNGSSDGSTSRDSSSGGS
jgi:RNA polymerase sigma factor (sigma-70 family)